MAAIYMFLAGVIFKLFFMRDDCCILNQITPNCVCSYSSINDKSALV